MAYATGSAVTATKAAAAKAAKDAETNLVFSNICEKYISVREEKLCREEKIWACKPV